MRTLRLAVGVVVVCGAGAASYAGIIDVTLTFSQSEVVIGDTVTATVTAELLEFSPGSYFTSIAADLIAGDPALASASPMTGLEWANPVLGGVSGGTPEGASLIGIFGAQLGLFPPVDYSNPFVVGSFELVAIEAGVLSYTMTPTDGYGKYNLGFSAYDPSPFSCPVIPCHQVRFTSQTLVIVPTPGVVGCLGASGVWVGRRKRE